MGLLLWIAIGAALGALVKTRLGASARWAGSLACGIGGAIVGGLLGHGIWGGGIIRFTISSMIMAVIVPFVLLAAYWTSATDILTETAPVQAAPPASRRGKRRVA